MDLEKVKSQMKVLYTKARSARKEGKLDIAKSFRAGGDKLLRKLKAAQPKTKKKKKEAS